MEYSDEEVLNLVLENNDDAKDYLYNKYRYIVTVITTKYWNIAKNLGLDYAELEQEAYYAFSDALRTFKADKNTTLSTFIYLCIERRLKKILRSNMGEKAKILNGTISLDNEIDGMFSLKELISDDHQFDPLNNLTNEENYKELLNQIKNELSEIEQEVFKHLIKGFDYLTIANLLNLNSKQVDNTIQRIKHKIKEIVNNKNN